MVSRSSKPNHFFGETSPQAMAGFNSAFHSRKLPAYLGGDFLSSGFGFSERAARSPVLRVTASHLALTSRARPLTVSPSFRSSKADRLPSTRMRVSDVTA